MFIHYKCGGNLIPIPDPFWFRRGRPPNRDNYFVRCDRCRLPGMVCEPPLDTEHLSV